MSVKREKRIDCAFDVTQVPAAMQEIQVQIITAMRRDAYQSAIAGGFRQSKQCDLLCGFQMPFAENLDDIVRQYGVDIDGSGGVHGLYYNGSMHEFEPDPQINYGKNRLCP